VRSSNSLNPPPETQGPSGDAPPLLHITLNTGRTTEHRDAELDPGLYALLQPLLKECSGAVPAMPGFAVAWAYCGDAVLIEIAYRAVHVAECGLAWGSQQASSLWEFLSAAASPKPPSANASGNGTAPSMPRCPWMAEVLLPSISKRPVADAMLLGGFERCLGLALLRHRRQPNSPTQRPPRLELFAKHKSNDGTTKNGTRSLEPIMNLIPLQTPATLAALEGRRLDQGGNLERFSADIRSCYDSLPQPVTGRLEGETVLIMCAEETREDILGVELGKLWTKAWARSEGEQARSRPRA